LTASCLQDTKKSIDYNSSFELFAFRGFEHDELRCCKFALLLLTGEKPLWQVYAWCRFVEPQDHILPDFPFDLHLDTDAYLQSRLRAAKEQLRPIVGNVGRIKLTMNTKLAESLLIRTPQLPLTETSQWHVHRLHYTIPALLDDTKPLALMTVHGVKGSGIRLDALKTPTKKRMPPGSESARLAHSLLENLRAARNLPSQPQAKSAPKPKAKPRPKGKAKARAQELASLSDTDMGVVSGARNEHSVQDEEPIADDLDLLVSQESEKCSKNKKETFRKIDRLQNVHVRKLPLDLSNVHVHIEFL